MIAVPYTVIVLSLLHAHRWARAGWARLSAPLGLPALARRRPLMSTIVLGVGTALAAAAVTPTRAGLPWLLVFAAGVLAWSQAASALLELPSTLAEIRRASARRWPERWFAPRLLEPLDSVLVRVAIDVAVVVTPPFVLLLVERRPSPCALVFLAAGFLVTADAMEALDHINIHRRVFRTRDHHGSTRWVFAVSRWLVEQVLCTMCLRMPGWYRIQHLYIHHVENSGIDDTQSTNRHPVGFIGFCRSALAFSISLVAPIDVLAYLVRRSRRRPARELLAAIARHYAMLAAIAWVNPWFTMGYLAIRASIGGVASTVYFYLWHGLIVRRGPRPGVLANTIDVVDSSTGHAFLGENYHIEHHLHPARHWSRLEADFVRHADDRARAGAPVVVLRDASEADELRQAIFASLWTEDHGRLSALLLDPCTVAALCTTRAPMQRWYQRCDRLLGHIALRLV